MNEKSRSLRLYKVASEPIPSSNGIRVFVAGSLEDGGRKKDNLEVYDDGRFLTVTGHVIGSKEGKS